MISRVMIATSIGPHKKYCVDILKKTILLFSENKEDIYLVDDVSEKENSKDSDIDKLSEFCKIYDSKYKAGWNRYQRCTANREQSRQHFLREKVYTHLLWLDADIVPDALALNTLLGHTKDIVTAIYMSRASGEPVIPMLDSANNNPTAHVFNSGTFSETEELYKCTGFGMGCMLVSREALENVSFRKPEELKEHTAGGEDWRWCMDAQAKGYDTYVDTNLPVWHCETHLCTRVLVDAIKDGVIWHGPSWSVQNDFGVFHMNMPRTDLTKEQVAILKDSPEMSVKPVRELRIEKRDLSSILAEI